MNAIIPLLFTVILSLVALLSLALARVAFRVHSRIRRVSTRKIAELTRGPGEVVGRGRALGEPPTTVRGEAVVVLRTEIETVIVKGSKAYRNPWAYDGFAAVPFELDDGTGALALEVDHVLPVAERRLSTFSAAEFTERFAERFPEIGSAILAGDTLREVRINETFVSGDGELFASGDAIETGESVAGADYRDARGTLRLRGTAERPLILSAHGEAEVQKHLLHPARMLTFTAVLAAVVVAMLWGVRALIVNAAGL